MTFDRLQLLHDIMAQVDQSQLVVQGPLQEFHPAAITVEQLEQLRVLAADVQLLRDSIMQPGPSPRLHFATLERHRREAPVIWAAIAMLLPLRLTSWHDRGLAVDIVVPPGADPQAYLHTFFELTAIGRAALDSHEGA